MGPLGQEVYISLYIYVQKDGPGSGHPGYPGGADDARVLSTLPGVERYAWAGTRLSVFSVLVLLPA